MNKYLSLTKTFISSVEMSKPQDKRRAAMMVVLSLFAVFGILIPISFGAGFLVHVTTSLLSPMGHSDLGITLMLHAISIFTFIFGISVILNELYFSNDIEYLLPWPLRAYQIVAAKFTATGFSENIMQAILVLACVIGYGTAARMGLLNWLLSVVGLITLPIIPLVYCTIICMFIMAFTRLIKNKDIMQRISVILIFLFIIVLFWGIASFQNMDMDLTMRALSKGEPEFMKLLNMLLPGVPLFVKTFSEGSFFALIQYLAINAVWIVVMLALSEVLYFKGVIGRTGSVTKSSAKHRAAIIEKCRVHSPGFSYFLKEVRILLRTPIFFSNCILVNFLWPVLIYGVIKLLPYHISIASLRAQYASGDINIRVFFLFGTVALSVIVTALNSISSNAISREGKHFSFMKYIPVPYKTQWNVKVRVGILFPVLGIFIYYIPLFILIRMPLTDSLLYLGICLLSVCLIAYLGIYIDSNQPKLIWDDELSALRENYNTFFTMAIAIGIGLFICLGGFLLFYRTDIIFSAIAVIVLLLLTTANLLVFILTSVHGVKNIEEQEET